MGFLIVIAAASVGLAVFVLLTQMAVRNGIRMSGLIDWKTQYELERKVKEQALKYINSRNSTHVANAWIFLGIGIVLCVVVVLIVASSDSMM
jgi:hypothetical protein